MDGSTGQAMVKSQEVWLCKTLEAIEIRLVEKGGAAPEGEGDSYKYPVISYNAHSQSIGWQGERFNGQQAGVTGQAKRMEALRSNCRTVNMKAESNTRLMCSLLAGRGGRKTVNLPEQPVRRNALRPFRSV